MVRVPIVNKLVEVGFDAMSEVPGISTNELLSATLTMNKQMILAILEQTPLDSKDKVRDGLEGAILELFNLVKPSKAKVN